MLQGALLGTALALAAPAAASAQTAVERPPIRIAVTESGLRIECIEAAAGDSSIRTPFGLYSTPTDLVAAVEEGGAQLETLLALHAAGVLDELGLAQDLSTAGQLTALTEHARTFALRTPERLEPYLLLEAWGARLDPVPRELPREKRVAWLWERVMDDDWSRTVLAAAWLRNETSGAYQTASERVVSITDLRRALRSRRPAHRRAAALIAGKQQEFSLREPLLSASLADPVAGARDGAARGCSEVHPQSSLEYWSRNLATGLQADRVHAARNLGSYGGAGGLKVLVHVLAAADHAAGDRFQFAGREIFVVSNASAGAGDLSGKHRNPADQVLLPSDPEKEYVSLGSRFKVTRVQPELTAEILAALDDWSGERTGRSPQDWLAWYLESLEPAGREDS